MSVNIEQLKQDLENINNDVQFYKKMYEVSLNKQKAIQEKINHELYGALNCRDCKYFDIYMLFCKYHNDFNPSYTPCSWYIKLDK